MFIIYHPENVYLAVCAHNHDDALNIKECNFEGEAIIVDAWKNKQRELSSYDKYTYFNTTFGAKDSEMHGMTWDELKESYNDMHDYIGLTEGGEYFDIDGAEVRNIN